MVVALNLIASACCWLTGTPSPGTSRPHSHTCHSCKHTVGGVTFPTIPQMDTFCMLLTKISHLLLQYTCVVAILGDSAEEIVWSWLNEAISKVTTLCWVLLPFALVLWDIATVKFLLDFSSLSAFAFNLPTCPLHFITLELSQSCTQQWMTSLKRLLVLPVHPDGTSFFCLL